MLPAPKRRLGVEQGFRIKPCSLQGSQRRNVGSIPPLQLAVDATGDRLTKGAPEINRPQTIGYDFHRDTVQANILAEDGVHVIRPYHARGTRIEWIGEAHEHWKQGAAQ